MENDNNYSIDEAPYPNATSPDVLGHVATKTATVEKTYRDMTRYTLSVEQVVQCFADAGVPRSPKTIQRYCTDHHLDYVVADTEKNSRFLIDPISVERRITQLQQAKDVSKPVGEMSRHVATQPESTVATSPDTSRQQVNDQDRETIKQILGTELSNHEREMYERLLDAKQQQIELLMQDKQELQNDKVILQRMHEREVELLLKTNQDTTKSSNMIMNLIHAIWPNEKNGSGKEIPERFIPVVRDVPDTLSKDEEEEQRS